MLEPVVSSHSCHTYFDEAVSMMICRSGQLTTDGSVFHWPGVFFFGTIGFSPGSCSLRLVEVGAELLLLCSLSHLLLITKIPMYLFGVFQQNKNAYPRECISLDQTLQNTCLGRVSICQTLVTC